MFAIWLALVMGEAGFVHHACPMHDGPAAAPVSHGHSHPVVESDDHAGRSAPTGEQHHGCTCIGACSVTTAGIAVVAPAELPAPRVTQSRVVLPAGDDDLAPLQRTPFAIPFANGPPSAIA